MPNHETESQHRTPLEELDDVKHGLDWRQTRTVLISSTGFFTDAYDIFIVNLITPMLGYVYYSDNNNKMPSDIQGPFKGMVSFGQLVGQLTFGFLGDAFGRKAIYGLELLVIILATINCATAGSAVEGVGAVGFLGFWRFVLGFGIGGDYPMSATTMSEWASTRRRGQLTALIFSMQGVGNVCASLVTIVLLAIFKTPVEAKTTNLDYVWRLCVGLGAIPAALTVYGRLTMPESPRYSVNVQNDPEKAKAALEATTWKRVTDDPERRESSTLNSLNSSEPIEQQDPETKQAYPLAKPSTGRIKSQKEIRKENLRDFRKHFSKWKNLKVLLGVSLCWFLMDIAFYGINLNQSLIISAMGFTPANASPWQTLFRQALGNLILSVLGALPGYFTTVLLIEKMGRKPIQILGSAMVGILFIILGAAWKPIHSVSVALFIVLFALVQYFFNFGPNTTTFVLPSEVFPTRHRAKAHGIASASGKLGAIIATFSFNVLADVGGPPGEQHFLPGVLIIFGVIMLLCIPLTTWIPETKGRSLDQFESPSESEHVN